MYMVRVVQLYSFPCSCLVFPKLFIEEAFLISTAYYCLFCLRFSSVQFMSVAQLCLTLCDPMNRSTPGLPVHHQLLEFTQTHLHRVSDAISSPSPSAFNLSQHQSFPMSQFFSSVGQSIGTSASASVLAMKWGCCCCCC